MKLDLGVCRAGGNCASQALANDKDQGQHCEIRVLVARGVQRYCHNNCTHSLEQAEHDRQA